MGKLIANYHTHNRLCNHAVGTCKDYVLEAIKLGYQEIGLTDHDPIREEFMSKEDYEDNWCFRNMKEDEFYNIYLKEIEYVKENYSDKISIKSGLECEYLDGKDDFYKELKSHLDYLNLGQHFFLDRNNKLVNSYHGIDYTNVIDYANAVVRALNTGLFKILVHPDLFMFDYRNIDGKREFDAAAVKASKIILDACEKLGIYAEVNVNGLANSRKYNSEKWLYPFDAFWRIAKDYKYLKIIIGIDAHDPKSLESQDIDDVIKFTKDLGLNVLDKVEW